MNIKLSIIGISVATMLFACGEKTAEKTETTTQNPPATTQKETKKQLAPVFDMLNGGEDSELAFFFSFVQAANIANELTKDNYTVFAPNKAAFMALGDAKLEQLVANQGLMTKIAKTHIVKGKYKISDLKDGQILTTIQGNTLTIKKDGEKTKVGNANVNTADIEATNGFIHILDKVL